MQGGADAVPVRLRNALARILSRSLISMRPLYLPLQPTTSLPGQPPGLLPQGVGVSMIRSGSATEPTALINAGNMHGLQVSPALLAPPPPPSQAEEFALPFAIKVAYGTVLLEIWSPQL